MDTPIISPLYIYILGILDPINIIVFILAIFSFIASICLVSDCTLKHSPNKEFYDKLADRTIVTCIICTFLCVVIPSKTTAIQMIVASYITPNNLVKTGQSIDNTIDKVIEKIIKIKSLNSK